MIGFGIDLCGFEDLMGAVVFLALSDRVRYCRRRLLDGGIDCQPVSDENIAWKVPTQHDGLLSGIDRSLAQDRRSRRFQPPAPGALRKALGKRTANVESR